MSRQGPKALSALQSYFFAHSQGGLHLQGLQEHCFPAKAVVAKAPAIMVTANKAVINFFIGITSFRLNLKSSTS
jgi:hypothetical protein